ncbi:MAG: glycogen debranching protein GlgX [Dissulfurispiraceae bacterium]
MNANTADGSSYPLGSVVYPDGVNFSVFSKSATSIELLLFDNADDIRPSRVIGLCPKTNKTYHYWHVFVGGIGHGQIYGYRAYGPSEQSKGSRFDPEKVLLDPYGKAVSVPEGYDRLKASLPGDNCATAMKSIVIDLRGYNWQGDKPLKRPFSKTVIYEMHVGGFTKHPGSGVQPEKRGTYAGVTQKIPYLKDLGVTAVELLPVFQFDPQDCPQRLVNYWGYCPVSFFAPHQGYSSRKDPLGPFNEFRDMVKALHRAGIEVILDVVYNHTAEGNHTGPVLCWRGLENSVYYMLEADDQARYADYSGTGNTLNTNQTIVRRMILDSLRYWVQVMHVDGFRFDLASILSRDEEGRPLTKPPLLLDIETDPVLAGIKLIAEAWDPGGLYQLGSFISDRWKEWNGQFRDDIRRFVRGDNGSVSKLSARLFASPDIFGHEKLETEQSINFVTCHDGFTLNDLVTYSEKHNLANGEQNRDGYDDNLSWNCGFEGPTDDPGVELLRCRQIKNFFTLDLLALGTPMLLMGDEARRTQLGNNNAYCQDNELSWFDWSLTHRHKGLHRFVKELIAYRRLRVNPEGDDDLSLNELLAQAQVKWHGVRLDHPDWAECSHSLAFTALNSTKKLLTHVMMNAYSEPLQFEIPPAEWRRCIDTFLESPEDILEWDNAPVFQAPEYLVQPYSIVVLFSVGELGEPYKV